MWFHVSFDWRHLKFSSRVHRLFILFRGELKRIAVKEWSTPIRLIPVFCLKPQHTSAQYRHADRQHTGISSRFRQPHAPSPCRHQFFIWDIITLDKGHTNVLRLFCQWLGFDSVISRKMALYKVPLRSFYYFQLK